MKQVNFRLSDDEYKLVEVMAHLTGKSVPALVKEITTENLHHHALNVAISLYTSGKIGLKQAWKLSGRTFHEFTRELVRRDIEPPITDEMDDKMLAMVDTLRLEDMFPGKTRQELRALLYPGNEPADECAGPSGNDATGK